MRDDALRSGFPDRVFWRGFWLRLCFGFAITLGVLAVWYGTMEAGQRAALVDYWANLGVSAPSFDIGKLLAVPLSVQLHVEGAMAGLVIGVVIFLLPKGTGFHRMLGWSWVASMIVVAATSIAMIADFNTGINVLHVFTALTVVALWGGLTGIRRGDVRRHAGSMVGLYIGGLIIAGAFAFIPGRLMWQIVFGG